MTEYEPVFRQVRCNHHSEAWAMPEYRETRLDFISEGYDMGYYI